MPLARASLLAAVLGAAMPFVVRSSASLVPEEALGVLIVVLDPAAVLAYALLPPEWIAIPLTATTALIISTCNAILYAPIGAWVATWRSANPLLRTGVPLAYWSSVVLFVTHGLPWLLIEIVPWMPGVLA